jgi:hypothetical protein
LTSLLPFISFDKPRGALESRWIFSHFKQTMKLVTNNHYVHQILNAKIMLIVCAHFVKVENKIEYNLEVCLICQFPFIMQNSHFNFNDTFFTKGVDDLK